MSFAKEQAIVTLEQCIKDVRNRYVTNLVIGTEHADAADP